ncbi:MAG: Dabb family protein [Mycobacteriaceae bacterium]|nr:Dabb family protein [Mycobacteriaceae bacterium]
MTHLIDNPGRKRFTIMNKWLSNVLTTQRLTRRLALAAPVALAASCTTNSHPADTHQHPSPIRHVVAFRYRSTVTPQQKNEVAKKFLTLRKECERSGNDYIVDIVGGDCTGSIEGLTAGFEQVFIVEFKNKDDYLYYIGKPFSSTFDPAHDEFKKFVTPLLSVDPTGKTDGAIVFDF